MIDAGERRPTDSANQLKVSEMTELTQDEIDQVHGGGFLSKFGKFLGFTAVGILGGQLGWWQWIPH